MYLIRPQIQRSALSHLFLAIWFDCWLQATWEISPTAVH